MTEYLTIEAVDGLSVSPDRFILRLILSEEPDDLLRHVIEQWALGPAELKSLAVVRNQLVVETELDIDAPANALRWLYGGEEPALVQMQHRVMMLRTTEREALDKVRQAFERPV